MVVVAVDADEARTVDEGVEDLGGLEVDGDEDGGLQVEAGGVSGERVREVAGRGTTDGGEAGLLRVGEWDGDDAIIERERLEAARVVLDVEMVCADAFAEVVRANKRREAYGKVRLEAFGDGAQRGVTPDAGGAGGDGFAGEDAAHSLQVVGDFQGGETVGTGGEGLVAKELATLIALQFVPATGIVHSLS